MLEVAKAMENAKIGNAAGLDLIECRFIICFT